jgi:uncharacterized SAM-binding protein YcdF (DUF218 family)
MLKLIHKFLTILIVTICIPLLLWGSGFIAFTAAIYYMSEPATTDMIDGAIVLTGGSNRVSKGLDLLADKKIKDLLVSGVHKDVEIKDIMTLWGKKDKVPPCCITLGREAGNTIGNAQEAKKWIEHSGLKEVYLITANYHMPRALLEFNHEIPDVKIIPFPVKPENFDIRENIFWRTDFIEYHKTLLTIFRVVVYPEETEAYPEALIPHNKE